MRKNSIDTELTGVEGGVAFVDDVQVRGVSFAGTQSDEEVNTLLLTTKKRCPSAYVFSSHAFMDAHTRLSADNAEGGYTKAVFLCGKGTQAAGDDVTQEAKTAFGNLARHVGCERNEVCAVSVGKVGEYFPEVSTDITSVELSIGNKAIGAGLPGFRQTAYTFSLGDFPCKIGVLYTVPGNNGNGANTRVVCLVTDINITPQMLNKAFKSAVEDTLHMLHIGVETTPRDLSCMLATCTAGNYAVCCVDGEYKKFVGALKNVLQDVCKKMSIDATKHLTVEVNGAKSKKIAVAIAAAVTHAGNFCAGIVKNRFFCEELLCILSQIIEVEEMQRVQINVQSSQGKLTLWDYGKATNVGGVLLEELLQKTDVRLTIHLHAGNYRASAYAALR